MKKLMVIVLAGCALVMSQGFREVAALQGWTPLENLAGTYSTTGQGLYSFALRVHPRFRSQNVAVRGR